MITRRHFTVMILPDAHLRLRRVHVRGSHLVWLLAIAVVVTGMAVSAPLLGLWGRGLATELAQVQAERDQLAERSGEIEATLADLRARLEQSERRWQKVAVMAGLDLSSIAQGGQGQPNGIASLEPLARAEMLKAEADDLAEGGQLLARRSEMMERIVGEQQERLARVPSLLPVSGLPGAGYGWRRDPFTGLRQFHRGVDIGAPPGTPIIAPGDGIVLSAQWDSGYGRVLTISHGDGIVTRYAHLSATSVKAGQRVKRGQTIAAVGNTGRSTGPHLHYEVLIQGKQVNPIDYLLAGADDF